MVHLRSGVARAPPRPLNGIPSCGGRFALCWRPSPGGRNIVNGTFTRSTPMPPTLQELGLDALRPADRLALAQALWDSVNDDLAAEPVDPAVRAELERRAALADADPSRGVPWEAVRAAAKARWPR
jgi:putative addiction module component (TIGR02574 family)